MFVFDLKQHRCWFNNWLLVRSCTGRMPFLSPTTLSASTTTPEGDVVKKTSLCGRDGRTLCGPQCVPKSTYVTLAHKRKQKFFYFGCSLVRRFYCKKVNKNNNGTDGQTDRQTDRRTDRVRRNMRPPPREEGRIINGH